MKTRSFPGGASVLVILIMFIMLSLGALRLTSSYADLKLARASTGWIVRYYELEKEANGKLQKANMTLANAFNVESQSFSRDKLRLLENNENGGWGLHEKDGNIFISCNVSLEGEVVQNLFVELLPAPPDENGRYYKIFQWRQWQEGFEYDEEGLDIWMG